MSRSTRNHRSGFSLVEIMIALAIFTGLLTMFSMSLSAHAAVLDDAQNRSELRHNAEKALAEIRGLLGKTQITLGFPQVFDGNDVGAAFPELAHAPANGALAGVDVRELAYLQPVDADGDDWPDVLPSGSVEWEAAPSALVLIGEEGGGNGLYVIEGETGERRRLAGGVASFVVDDSASTGFAIPLNTLRVRLGMTRSAGNAQAPPETFTALINMSRDEDLP